LAPVVLPYLAVARVSGVDAGAFLQAQLSADVAALGESEATFACYCSPRGQVFGLLLVCRLGEEFRLVANRELLHGMVKRLGLFVLRARVELEMMNGLAVQGCQAGADDRNAGGAFEPGGLGLAYRLIEQTEGLAEDRGHWKERELLKGVVWLAPATSERFIPQMLGMEAIGAVSFSKGCYPGQEIIARARYLGKVKRRPLLLRLFDAPEPSAGESLSLRDGEQRLEGNVIDSVVTPDADPSGSVLVLAVAPVPQSVVKSVAFGSRDYRCATI
jgi:folate-binding protein YgfZ